MWPLPLSIRFRFEIVPRAASIARLFAFDPMTNYTHTQSYTLTFSSLSTSGSDSVRAIEGDPVTSIKKRTDQFVVVVGANPFFLGIVAFFSRSTFGGRGDRARPHVVGVFFGALSLFHSLSLSHSRQDYYPFMRCRGRFFLLDAAVKNGFLAIVLLPV